MCLPNEILCNEINFELRKKLNRIIITMHIEMSNKTQNLQ